MDDDRLAGAELAGERDGTVDHEVREVAQEELVLAARRLALGRVHDDDRPAAALGDGPDLAGDRKACAPAAGKPARLELAQQLAALELEPPVARKVLAQRHRAPGVEPREEPRQPGRGDLERSAHTSAPVERPAERIRALRELEDEREREGVSRAVADAGGDAVPVQRDDLPLVERRAPGGEVDPARRHADPAVVERDALEHELQLPANAAVERAVEVDVDEAVRVLPLGDGARQAWR